MRSATALFVFLTFFSCKKSFDPSVDLASTKTSLSSLAERGRSGVVLILNYKPDGTTTFGAGLIINDDGGIVTNSHVIDGANAVGVLLFRADRTTYSPLDGGLSRFLFEYQREIVSAAIIRKDESLDLAILRAQASTAKLTRLPFATKPVTIGENVIALGHPQEAAWSITRGVVSALPFGLVQHDALISPGSSGGPLLNESGEVVGIDTSMVKKAHGAGFARPIAMVRSFIDKEGSGLKIDLSTPARAEETCLRALEIGDSHQECIFESLKGDSQSKAKTDALAAELLIPKDDSAGFLSILKPIQAGPALALLASRRAASSIEFLPVLTKCESGSFSFICQKKGARQIPAPLESGIRTLRKTLAEAAPADLARAKEIALAHIQDFAIAEKQLMLQLRTSGLKLDQISEFRTLLHNGFRVEEVRQVDSDHAWILLTGRNEDGSPYRVSKYRHRLGNPLLALGGWTELSPTPDDMKTLPARWPPPLRPYDYWEMAVISAVCEGWFEYGLGPL